MPQPMTTRCDPRGFGIPLHLFLHCGDRERPVRALLIPEDIRAYGVRGAEGQTGLKTRHRIGGEIDAAIFPTFALWVVFQKWI
jgi:hypothetical protein